ncbi:MAG: hypothetical protein RLZZ224_278, partial [Verrucomicrobiota bacterium]
TMRKAAIPMMTDDFGPELARLGMMS